MVIASFPPPRDLSPARPDAAGRLARLIQVPTVSSAYPNHRIVGEFTDLLAELYPLVHSQLEFEAVGELGLVFRWSPAQASDAAPLVLMAHWDVVSTADQQWSSDPFAGEIRDGMVHGRGAIDDKGALVALLDAVENLLSEGFAPAREVLVCLGGDEEMDGRAGAAIAARFSERGVVPWLVLDEGGAVTDLPFPGVSGSFAMIGTTEKGILTVRLVATSTAGHASAPPRLTAAGRLARALERLRRRPFPVALPRTGREMLTALAPHASGQIGRLFALAAAAGPVTARIAGALGPEVQALVRTTQAVTVLEGGTQPNVLPTSVSATVNLRIAPGSSIAGVVARLEKVIGDDAVRVEIVSGSEPSPESGVDGPEFAALAAAVDAAYPGTAAIPFIVTAATDARHWHTFAPAVYRHAPLQIPAELRAGLHGPDERVQIDSLVRGERFYRALLKGLTP